MDPAERRVVSASSGAPAGAPSKASDAVRVGETIFVGGQTAVQDDDGIRGDLAAQAEAAIGRIEAKLAALDADLEDVAKVVCFYVSRGEVDEAALVHRLRRRFRGEPPPALTILPLPHLSRPGVLIEIECIAVRSADGARMPRQAGNPAGHWPWPFSHGVRCGEWMFLGVQGPLDSDGHVRAPGNVVEQAKINIDNMARVAEGLGGSLDDVCRFNTFYVGSGTSEDWAEAGRVRANAFPRPGVCGTGVPVPALYPEGLSIRQEATGLIGLGGERLERTPSLPPGHWDWPIPVKVQQGVRIGRTLMIGGQISADPEAKALHPGDLAAQTDRCMRYVEDVVKDLGGTMADLVKMNVFYADPHGPTAGRLQATLEVQDRFLTSRGPVVTNVPLAALGLTNTEIEIEAYAIVGGEG